MTNNDVAARRSKLQKEKIAEYFADDSITHSYFTSKLKDLKNILRYSECKEAPEVSQILFKIFDDICHNNGIMVLEIITKYKASSQAKEIIQDVHQSVIFGINDYFKSDIQRLYGPLLDIGTLSFFHEQIRRNAFNTLEYNLNAAFGFRKANNNYTSRMLHRSAST